MTRLRAQTVVDTAFHSPCGKFTDVRWAETRVVGYFGYTECKLRNTAGNCDRFRIDIDEVEMATSDHVASQRRQTFCHELGHTLGVNHDSGTNYPSGGGVADTAHSCLRNGRVPSAGKPWHTRYGPHHIQKHINPWFS
ncbi:hypothetical protein [Nocardioides alcanivorans]|uniref:hypothetical protein n=1 Tax=Nocardioides alcanivorans TaxID=2897352 RepID=UPI001F388757|nr:hypothetical protein [Nocardioides alcanivorans]